MMREDFFLLRTAGERRAALGNASCSLGHQLPHTDGRIDGIFAEWQWDGHTLRARNDRYGFYPLFCYRNGADIGVSPSVAALITAGADTALDDAALAVYLRLGQFVGDDTPFRHVRSLPPDGRLTWDGRDLRVDGGYRFFDPYAGMTRREAMDGYRELFRASVRRRAAAGGGCAVPLSGGRDSRHIVFELCASGRKPAICPTVLYYPEDVRVAALVCSALGVEHHVLARCLHPFETEARKNLATSFGVNDGAWALLLADFLAERGIGTIFDGIGGDVLSAGLFLTPELDALFRTGDAERIAERLLPDNEAILALLVAPDMLRRWPRSAAIERMAQEVRRHLGAHNPVTSFFFWNRTRRKIAQTPYSMLPRSLTVYAPYLDHDLFDFLARLPASLLMDHAFHTDVIREAYPQWSHLPFEDKNVDSHDFSLENAQFARRFSELAGLVPRCEWLRQPSFSARLLASRASRSFAAKADWYLKPALWLYQLHELAGGGNRASTFPAHGASS